MLGWGRKPSYRRAEAYAARRGLRCISLEDGFLRSRGLGADLVPPLALVADRAGIYYDPSRPSDIERLNLLREATQIGHSIGQIAALPTEQLRSLAVLHDGGERDQTAQPRTLLVEHHFVAALRYAA